MSNSLDTIKRSTDFNCKFKSQKPFTFTLTIVHLILQIYIDSIAEYSHIRIK